MSTRTRDPVADGPSWWSRMRATAPPGVRGSWFGRTELVPGGWHIYAAGTDGFDADDETAEWAVGPYAWLPDGRYFPVPDIAGLSVAGAVESLSRVGAGARSLEGH